MGQKSEYEMTEPNKLLAEMLDRAAGRPYPCCDESKNALIHTANITTDLIADVVNLVQTLTVRTAKDMEMCEAQSNDVDAEGFRDLTRRLRALEQNLATTVFTVNMICGALIVTSEVCDERNN